MRTFSVSCSESASVSLTRGTHPLSWITFIGFDTLYCLVPVPGPQPTRALAMAPETHSWGCAPASGRNTDGQRAHFHCGLLTHTPQAGAIHMEAP